MDNNQKFEKNNIQPDAKKIDFRLKNYVSPDGITNRQLETGLWYIERKPLLKKILYGFLILVGVISWVYTIYGYAYYFAVGMKEDDKLTKELVETNSLGHEYILQLSAKKISIAPVVVIKSAGNKYDFYVQLKNNNQKWWAEFDYYFADSEAQTKKSRGYILPLETKQLLALAQEFFYEPSQAQIILENIKWRRLKPAQYPDWPAFYQSHLNIQTSDIKFTPASMSPLSEKLNLNQLSFNALNNTPFNYWEVGLGIMLYNAGNLADVNYYILNDFMSGQKRAVEISWPGQIGRVDRVEIAPEINILRKDIYIPYQAGAGQEK